MQNRLYGYKQKLLSCLGKIKMRQLGNVTTLLSHRSDKKTLFMRFVNKWFKKLQSHCTKAAEDRFFKELHFLEENNQIPLIYADIIAALKSGSDSRALELT